MICLTMNRRSYHHGLKNKHKGALFVQVDDGRRGRVGRTQTVRISNLGSKRSMREEQEKRERERERE